MHDVFQLEAPGTQAVLHYIPTFKFPYLSMRVGRRVNKVLTTFYWPEVIAVVSADRCVPAVCIINEENNTQNAKRLNTRTSIFIT